MAAMQLLFSQLLTYHGSNRTQDKPCGTGWLIRNLSMLQELVLVLCNGSYACSSSASKFYSLDVPFW